MPKPRIPRCEACAATPRPCAPCRSTRRRELYAEQKRAVNPAYQKGKGGRPHIFPRCDKCRTKQGPCWACQQARMATDPEFAAKVMEWRRKAQMNQNERDREKTAAARVVRATQPRQPVERRPSLGKAEEPRDRHARLLTRQSKQVEKREPRAKCPVCMGIMRDDHRCRL